MRTIDLSRLRRGLTLIEMVVYVSLASVIVIAVTQVMMTLFATRGKTETLTEVQQSLRLAMDRIVSAGVNSRMILAADEGVLSLKYQSQSTPTTFVLRQGSIVMSDDSITNFPLTPPTVQVNRLSFIDLSESETDAVKIIIEATDTSSETTDSYTVQSSFLVRR